MQLFIALILAAVTCSVCHWHLLSRKRVSVHFYEHFDQHFDQHFYEHFCEHFCEHLWTKLDRCCQVSRKTSDNYWLLSLDFRIHSNFRERFVMNRVSYHKRMLICVLQTNTHLTCVRLINNLSDTHGFGKHFANKK